MSSTTECVIDSLAYGGDGVGRIEERVVFVPDTVPGDKAALRIVEDRGSFMRATANEILDPSPDRVTPPCPYADRCGGCQWQHIKYEAQIRWKRTIVEETLRRIGGIVTDVPECRPCPEQWGFRTVVRYPCAREAGRFVMGYHERRSHRIVDIGNCPAADGKVNAIAATIRTLAAEIAGFSPTEITIHSSRNEASALVSMIAPAGDDTVRFAERLTEAQSDIAGVVHRLESDERAGVCGEPFRIERIGDIRYRIEEQSFLQTNALQAETLVTLVREAVGEEFDGTVVDGYGGVGLISLGVSDRDTDIHLYDLSATAVRDSRFNARENGFARFTAHRFGPENAVRKIHGASVLILDPPRPGLGEKAVDASCSLSPRIIVYVSCNPSTLARDLSRFSSHGYRVERVTPLDMFPHTYHIESVAVLVKA